MVGFPTLNFGAVLTASGMAKLGQIIIGDLTMAGDNVDYTDMDFVQRPALPVDGGVRHPAIITNRPSWREPTFALR